MESKNLIEKCQPVPHENHNLLGTIQNVLGLEVWPMRGIGVAKALRKPPTQKGGLWERRFQNTVFEFCYQYFHEYIFHSIIRKNCE